ncbi:MAG TPA: DUF2934 domain-containing protein [Verrucomicrobiae bacterium]|nr:DUF2934 domain-containing protein [Verrucomicrobiae bacterium]
MNANGANGTNGTNGGTHGSSQFERARDGSITDEDIAARAYEIYEREGRGDGRDMDHWLRAESELRTERRKNQPGQQQSTPNSRQDAPRSARRQMESISGL